MRLPRPSIRFLMILTAFVAVAIRLALLKPTADEWEFLQIILGAVELTILFASLYFILWFAALAAVVLVRRFLRPSRE
jgi:hypothetical protein